ncbi:MAG: gliding motility lipoprotein GldD [Bacteroidota bacterium]|nr:gliding motility lipoprotein GldD [Bacteroidota bacterium]
MNKLIFLTIRTGLLLLMISCLATSCQQNYVPKPRGYFRIELPKRAYRDMDSTFPYKFSYPVYCKITPDPYSPNEPYWINVEFPKLNAKLHLSYKKIDHNLAKYLDDTHLMVSKHISKATAIEENPILDPAHHIYGSIFRIQGSEAASVYQFYVTDSIHHFMRGALYFNSVPNNDSLVPVIDFVAKDIDHLIETLRWKK